MKNIDGNKNKVTLRGGLIEGIIIAIRRSDKAAFTSLDNARKIVTRIPRLLEVGIEEMVVKSTEIQQILLDTQNELEKEWKAKFDAAKDDQGRVQVKADFDKEFNKRAEANGVKKHQEEYEELRKKDCEFELGNNDIKLVKLFLEGNYKTIPMSIEEIDEVLNALERK